MGMDVIGVNPATVEGERFRRNIWSWYPLAVSASLLRPAIVGSTRNGFSTTAGAWMVSTPAIGGRSHGSDK